jgi:hypothetical protein
MVVSDVRFGCGYLQFRVRPYGSSFDEARVKQRCCGYRDGLADHGVDQEKMRYEADLTGVPEARLSQLECLYLLVWYAMF